MCEAVGADTSRGASLIPASQTREPKTIASSDKAIKAERMADPFGVVSARSFPTHQSTLIRAVCSMRFV